MLELERRVPPLIVLDDVVWACSKYLPRAFAGSLEERVEWRE